MSESKKELRDEILKKRHELTTEEVNHLSTEVVNGIRETDAYKKAKKICIYMPFRNEVDVTKLMNFDDDKEFYIPRVEGEEMWFYAYKKNDELVEGTYGILEPANDEKLVPDEETLVIMPGAVYSVFGYRIGYGAGYYDRFLAKNDMCSTIGACYDFQILGSVPYEAHDVKADSVISDKRTFVINDVKKFF